jgi:hypothetical protein
VEFGHGIFQAFGDVASGWHCARDFLSALGRSKIWAAFCGLLAMALAEFCISWSSRCRRVGACTLRYAAGASVGKGIFCLSDSRTYGRRQAANKLLDGRFGTGLGKAAHCHGLFWIWLFHAVCWAEGRGGFAWDWCVGLEWSFQHNY